MAFGYTEVEIKQIEERNDEIIIKIKSIIKDIQAQAEVIHEKEKILELKTSIYEQYNGNQSWEAATEKKKLKTEMENAGIEFFAAKEQLVSLEDTRKSFIVKAANYQEIIRDANIESIPEPKPIQQNQTVAFTNQTEIILQNETDVEIELTEVEIFGENYTKPFEYIENQTKQSQLTRIIGSSDLSGIDSKIGIELTQSCLTSIKWNLNRTECPTYEDIVYLDNSNQFVSGKFITTDGWFHRNATGYQDSWAWYTQDETPRIFVDPPTGMFSKIKMITIAPNFKTYLVAEDSTREHIGEFDNKQQIDRVYYHDRYTNENCSKSTINAAKWQTLLPDTITFMQNNCNPASTEIEIVEVISTDKTIFDISKSSAWQYTQKLKWIIENCLMSYGACKEI